MNHTTESFLRIEAIFTEALATDLAERTTLIARRCDGDAAMIDEVNVLLRACEEEEEATQARHAEEAAPAGSLQRKRVGPYEIDKLIGRGGMGAVYLAHRADGQFEQKVAIKLIDLPLATDLFRERFRQERQILAGLNHPYIARLLDGGVTEGGDLYLAMEYIDGVPIHRYCRERKLATPQRLKLFTEVCEAVQFAHQNLVVHRDLKPDNIFVAEDGTPRLLDFGTAKLMSPSLADPGSEMTRQGFTSFTPQYASPEQVLGNPITTASDTYSLGVLLFLLLTGELPYELKEMTTAEMVRVICQEPPRKPGNEEGTERRLDPDLVAILNKSLRKEPRERYMTAAELAADIHAWLGGHPVAARRGTLRYRALKFARRNWIVLSGAALLAITLAAGVAGVVWQARVANVQRRKAEARSSDLRQLSNSLLSELDDAIQQLPGSTGAQKLLVTRVLEHLDRMAADAQGDRASELDLAEAYTRLGNLQGNAYDANLGDTNGAITSLDKAIALAEPLVNSAPSDPAALRALAIAQQSRGETLFGVARTREGVGSLHDAVKTWDRLIEKPDAPPALIAEVAAAYGALGDSLGQPGTASLGDSAAALTAYRHVADLDYRALRIDPNFLRSRRGLAIMQMKIGNVEIDTDPAQALKDFQESLARTESLPPAQRDSMATQRLRAYVIRREGDCANELGQYSTAQKLYTQALAINQKLSDADPHDLRGLDDLEVILDDVDSSYELAADPELGATPADRRRNLEKVLTPLNGVIELTAKMLKQDPVNPTWRALHANAQVRYSADRQQLGQPFDAGELAAGMATLKELASKNDALAVIIDQATGAFLKLRATRYADPQFTLTCAQRVADMTHRKIPGHLLQLAEAERANNQPDKARETAREGLALLPPQQPSDPKSRIRKLLEIEMK